MNSKIALAFSMLIIVLTGLFYYPKWNKQGPEATLSWDVSGYYMYLPAIFIYEDVKQMEFKDSLREKYNFTPYFGQAFLHEKSGNLVFKYPAGQALQYLPFFTIAHITAKIFGYNADGFSLPYQMAISLGALLVALTGLYYLRKVLLSYFTQMETGITLLILVLATNYLNYAAIDGPLTHNLLFTIYAVLLYATHQFYLKPTLAKSLLIGALCGWATLTRPTEIISVIIPLLWGVYSLETIKGRFQFIFRNIKLYASAIVAFVLVGALQIIYWKYVTGEFFVYSYQEQSFSWLHPHFYDGIFSFRSGWLIYTPVMIFSLIGFWFLFKRQRVIFPGIAVFSAVFIYLCFAWDIWWYGGSLGIRAMVQSYPVLAFPLAAFIGFISHNFLKYLFAGVFILCCSYNVWLTHQAHLGGLWVSEGMMTEAYFWKIFFKSKEDVPVEALKLLDTEEEFSGIRKDAVQIFAYDFEADSASDCSGPISGNKSFCLTKDKQSSPEFFAPLTSNESEFVRAKATFLMPDKEWDTWKMCQFIVRFYNNDKIVKTNFIRVPRLLDSNSKRDVFIDTKLPEESFNKVSVQFWNADSQKEIKIDNLFIEKFNG